LKKALISPVLKAQRHLETRILVADGKYLVAKNTQHFGVILLKKVSAVFEKETGACFCKKP